MLAQHRGFLCSSGSFTFVLSQSTSFLSLTLLSSSPIPSDKRNGSGCVGRWGRRHWVNPYPCYVIICYHMSSCVIIYYDTLFICYCVSYVIICHHTSCVIMLSCVTICYHMLSWFITCYHMLSFYCSTSAILAVTVIPFYLHFQSIRCLEMRKGATGTDTWQEVAVALSCRQEGICLIMVPHIWLVASQTSTVHVGTRQGRSQPGEYRKEAETILPQILYTTGAFSKDHLNLGNFFSSLYLSFHFS